MINEKNGYDVNKERVRRVTNLRFFGGGAASQ